VLKREDEQGASLNFQQFAKRFEDLALRIDWWVNTFGFGADLFNDDKGRVRVDMGFQRQRRDGQAHKIAD
jgi:hypothetical protein